MSNKLAKREPMLPAEVVRQDIEALSDADLFTFAERASEYGELAWAVFEDRLGGWVDEGLTQTEIGRRIGRDQRTVSYHCKRLGIAPSSNRGRPRITNVGNSEPFDSESDQTEEVEAEVVEDEPASRSRRHSPQPTAAHYLPDVMAPDADQNLRTQALHWFEQGVAVRRLLDKKKELIPRSQEDREAIKREASAMERTARRIKEML